MFQALVKKQLLELNAFYFQNRKTGQRRSRKGLIGIITIYIILFLVLAVMFFGISFMTGDGLLQEPSTYWIYFAVMGLMAILLGTFGSVFNTYAGMYLAKDNELLISMPVPSYMIIGARLIGAFAMSLLYTALVWVPACVGFWIMTGATALQVINQILLLPVISVLVTVLTCIFGFLVALISSRISSRSFFVVVLSILFFAVYYYVCLRLNALIQSLVAHSDAIGDAIRGWIWPLYQMALAAAGKPAAMIFFTIFTLAAFALCAWIISRSFAKIATMKKGEKKVKYEKKMIKATDVSTALFRRELKRFTASPTYMLNAGLGIVILPVVAIIALIRADFIRGILAMGADVPWLSGFIGVAAAAEVCMALSMNAVTAPSISLEGKAIWLIQSLPVNPWDVLKAKEKLHLVLNIPAAVFSMVILARVLEVGAYEMAASVFLIVAFIWFMADLGLVLNLRSPNLNWTSENVPIKQSGSVFITLFGGWVLSVIIAGGFFLLRNHMDGAMFLIIAGAILAAAVRFMRNWLYNKGTLLFEQL